jgi:hypothetical protein
MNKSYSGNDSPAVRFCAWLCQPGKTFRRWQSPLTVCASWLGLVLAVLTPPRDAGTTICWIKRTTGIDCPGCGLTHSLSCGLRGMFAESLACHPFGLLILGLFLFTAALSLFPAARRCVAAFVEARPVLFNGLYLAFITGFVAFGAIRAFIEIIQHASRF